MPSLQSLPLHVQPLTDDKNLISDTCIVLRCFITGTQVPNRTRLAQPLLCKILVGLFPCFFFFLNTAWDTYWVKLSELMIKIIIHIISDVTAKTARMWDLLYTLVIQYNLSLQGVFAHKCHSFLSCVQKFSCCNLYRLPVTGMLVSGAQIHCFR